MKFVAYGASLLAVLWCPLLTAQTLRSSTMNEDIVIQQTLFAALSASVGKVQQVTTKEQSVALTSGRDLLVCSSSSCVLTWDSVSSNYPQMAAEFASSLYDILKDWADNGGKTDPSVHETVYPETGSIDIVVSGGVGTTDFVQCNLLASVGSSTKSCRLTLSDYETGTSATLQNLFHAMVTGQTEVEDQLQSLLQSVSGTRFLPERNVANGNGVVSVTRRLDTTLIQDTLQISKNYAYVTPEIQADGQHLVDGISILLSGSVDRSTNYKLQDVSAEPYVQSQIIP